MRTLCDVLCCVVWCGVVLCCVVLYMVVMRGCYAWLLCVVVIHGCYTWLLYTIVQIAERRLLENVARVRDVELLTGLRFFPDLDPALSARLRTHVPTSLWTRRGSWTDDLDSAPHPTQCPSRYGDQVPRSSGTVSRYGDQGPRSSGTVSV